MTNEATNDTQELGGRGEEDFIKDFKGMLPILGLSQRNFLLQSFAAMVPEEILTVLGMEVAAFDLGFIKSILLKHEEGLLDGDEIPAFAKDMFYKQSEELYKFAIEYVKVYNIYLAKQREENPNGKLDA